MSRPLVLDLFCGAGGMGTGLYRAGFDVLGVDLVEQPRYPFDFVRADALTFPLAGFDAVHASPPCQAYSEATGERCRDRHPRLIEPIRERLVAYGRPAVIENVPRAPLVGPILCGTMFGLVTETLELRRHRRFEAIGWEWPVLMAGCAHGQRKRTGGVYGGGGEDRAVAARHSGGGFTPDVATRRELMGMPWATQDELSEAVPPAYGEFVGRRLIEAL